MTQSQLKLTDWTTCGGCAAKWPGGRLRSLIQSVGDSSDPDLLHGLAPFDDAAVYRVGSDQALVSTTDFFPPLVDDPSDFGAIAAANACSDVFAMGGRVVLALNIAAFPEEFPESAIAEVFESAAAVVRQAGGTVAGGHTIRSAEPIFGLAVQGLVRPDKVWTKGGARPGDVMMLSKPVGSGIVLAGGDREQQAAAISVMRALNQSAAADLHEADSGVHAVTDVTGFGLAGHSWELAEHSGVALEITMPTVPVYDGVIDLAKGGVRTGGDARNRSYLGNRLNSNVTVDLETVALDPQTSGGLLAAVDPGCSDLLRSRGWWIVGLVVAGDPAVMLLSDPAG